MCIQTLVTYTCGHEGKKYYMTTSCRCTKFVAAKREKRDTACRNCLEEEAEYDMLEDVVATPDKTTVEFRDHDLHAQPLESPLGPAYEQFYAQRLDNEDKEKSAVLEEDSKYVLIKRHSKTATKVTTQEDDEYVMVDLVKKSDA